MFFVTLHRREDVRGGDEVGYAPFLMVVQAILMRAAVRYAGADLARYNRWRVLSIGVFRFRCAFAERSYAEISVHFGGK